MRILKKPIEATVKNTINTVQSIILLHNWLHKQDENNIYIPPNVVYQNVSNGFQPRLWRQEDNDNSAIQNAN